MTNKHVSHRFFIINIFFFNSWTIEETLAPVDCNYFHVNLRQIIQIHLKIWAIFTRLTRRPPLKFGHHPKIDFLDVLGSKISVLSSIIKILVFWHRKISKLFKPWNSYQMKTRNIFTIRNDFSRRFRRCRIWICNNPKITNLRGGGGGVCL